MHFMRPAYCPEVEIVAVPEQFKPLVYENIMDHKICKAINGDAEADVQQCVQRTVYAQRQANDAGYGEDQKEIIVLFEKRCGVLFMVVFMQPPQQAMHHELMG